MPLEDLAPRLDDRKYDDLVAEIRARVSRYTPEWKPEWNDLNDNDPGMILAQVFAWLSDMLLYRMNQVPDLHYAKFLELIGVELRAAQPATTEITFQVAAASDQERVDIPERTQVAANVPGGPPLVFETARALAAVNLVLASVQADDGAQYRDETERNTGTGAGFLPFGQLPRDGGALTLGFDLGPGYTAAGRNVFPPLTIDLAFWVAPAADGAQRVQQCGPLSTRAYAPALLQWEGWNGTGWAALDTLGDETLAFTRSGHVRVRVGSGANLLRDYIGAYEALDGAGAARVKLFWLRARLVRSQYERAPRLVAVRTNTVAAIQAQTMRGEILGGSDGGRNQKWRLANAPVLKGSVHIAIDEGTGSQEWEIRDDLFGSGPRDRHLMVNYTTGEVLAGDGETGAIPVANPNDPDTNVVAIEYRYGGGLRGNVAAGLVKDLLTPVEGIDAGKTANLFVASGGSNEERLDAAQRRARLALRAHERAVTPEDFEQLARDAGNVARARALPLAHPDFPGVKVPGTITVIVVPDDGSSESPDPPPAGSPPPVPSEGLLRTVCEFLDARRLLASEVFVVAPRYVPLAVDVQVVLKDEADPGTVKLAVERALARYFHPLLGGDDGKGWAFGGALRYSKIVQRVFADGVDSVPRLILTLDGEARPECRDTALESIAPNALLTLVEATVETIPLSDYEASSS
jgi:predicted phage baseplate assembly protein